MKSVDVVHSGEPDIQIVIVRPGGFYILKLFMGCIGIIMAGSGLEYMFYTIYDMWTK